MGLGLALHIQFNLSEKLFLFQSYSINIIMAMIALLLLDYGIRKKTNNLVFIYLITISIKFATYIFFFYPKFNLDGELDRQEFFIFFAPYILGLILEINFLARRYR
ncbi:MAG: hypothetical protein CMC01_01770 [Flavobacteriaceae bacterium]|nr:hypothetical protein [Flavobacteriaceae bacterium]